MKKGFTLIELLAVIVILAIIAVIAVPIVLNIIDETKNNATLRSADFYLDAVELSVAQATLKDKNIQDGTYNIKDGDICLNEECNDKLEVEVNGEVPESGTITIMSGNISDLSLVMNDKKITRNNKGETIYYEQLCTVAKQDSTKYSVGDVVTCELSESTDKFYIIEEQPLTATSIQMLTEKNIHTTEYRQSSTAGTVAFSSTNYWSSETTYPVDVYDERNDRIKPIVDNYVSYLNGSLIEDATGSLLTYNQAKNLGCDDSSRRCSSAPTWVYSTGYWTGSAYDSAGVRRVNSTCYFGRDDYYAGNAGVRPVITISTKNIK